MDCSIESAPYVRRNASRRYSNPASPMPLGLEAGIDMPGMIAVAAIKDQVSAMIGEAADADLLCAYKEIERRSLDV